MSAAKHTRGPLIVKPEAAFCHHNGDIAIVNAKNTLIALAYARPVEGEALANAHLIAAAPELLTALVVLRTAKNLVEADRIRIDAALAKATGIPAPGAAPGGVEA